MPKPKFDVSLGTESLELVSVFKEASRNFKCTFLFYKAGKKFKPFVHVRKVIIKLYKPYKKFLSGDPIPLMSIAICQR
jgi:hypothetical protein